jgi:hypothetical protein
MTLENKPQKTKDFEVVKRGMSARGTVTQDIAPIMQKKMKQDGSVSNRSESRLSARKKSSVGGNLNHGSMSKFTY